MYKFDLSKEVATGVTLADALAHVCENGAGSVSQSRKLLAWAEELKESKTCSLDTEDYNQILWPALDKGDLKAFAKARIADELTQQKDKQDAQRKKKQAREEKE